MKKNRISHLSTHDKKAIYALVQHLQADYSHEILKLVLFGSNEGLNLSLKNMTV